MVHEHYVLLRLSDLGRPLPPMLPGQFAEVRIDGVRDTFLRRPISICFADTRTHEVWLLVAAVGEGTRQLTRLRPGDRLNCVLPLGNGFSVDTAAVSGCRPLLVGGGVGVAPLLYLGAALRWSGVEPTFLLGARSGRDLLLLDEFRKYGHVLVTTEDGSEGERGFVTQHSVLNCPKASDTASGEKPFSMIYTCGPTPMMKAVAGYAREHAIRCEASLENMMACGLGACLCCVEKTRNGNLCVCKDGPVFSTADLLWA